jgi:hypothetical protein
MAKFVRCTTNTQGLAYFLNVDQISYMLRSEGSNYTAVYFDKDHTIAVRETPEHIQSHMGD